METSSDTRANIQDLNMNVYFLTVNQLKKKKGGGGGDVKNNLDHPSKWLCAPGLTTLQRNVFSILVPRSIQDGQK